MTVIVEMDVFMFLLLTLLYNCFVCALVCLMGGLIGYISIWIGINISEFCKKKKERRKTEA